VPGRTINNGSFCRSPDRSIGLQAEYSPQIYPSWHKSSEIIDKFFDECHVAIYSPFMPQVKQSAQVPLTRHHVREKLQSMILSGERRPGSKLRQQELAEHFQVAQGVVREALLELQAYGLVETIDRRGMFVTNLDEHKLLEAFEVREFHEALAVRLCCERANRAQIRELMDLAEDIFQLGSANRFDEMGSLDRKLHSQLIHLAGNGMLMRLAENYRVLGKFVRADRDPAAVRDEHIGFLQAIQDGRADDAEQLIRRHVAAARLAVEKRLQSGEFIANLVV
jgi:DNA-binding GntR family transcriptional regulator